MTYRRLRTLLVVITIGLVLGTAAPAGADTVTDVPGTSILEGVSCATASVCWASGNSNGQRSGAVVPITAGKVGSVQNVANSNDFYGVGCWSTTNCVAVGTGETASEGVTAPISTSVGGLAPVSGTAYIHGVACDTNGDCVGVGWETGAQYNFPNAKIGVVVPIVGGVAQAVEQISGTLDLYAVACSGYSSCVAVGIDASGGADADAVVVPIHSGTAGAAESVSTAPLQGVACSSDTSCVAVGQAIVPITNGAPGAVESLPSGTSLWGASCPDASTCWAAGDSMGLTGVFIKITNGVVGAPVSEAGTVRLYGISCIIDSCVAVGQAPPLGGGPGVVVTFGATAGPQKYLDVAIAKNDLIKTALPNAISYCTPTALGLYGFGTGVLLIGTASPLAVAGALTAYSTFPFCLATIKRVLTDYHRIKDPPGPDYGQLAKPGSIKAVKPPSCSRWKGALGRFCAQLRSAERRWAQDAERVAAIDTALATTQGREHSALAADDQADATLQDGQLKTLDGQEAAAIAAQHTAGRAVAKILRAHHIGFRLSKARSRKTIADVERVLAKQGLSPSELRSFGSSALTPRAINLLTQLG